MINHTWVLRIDILRQETIAAGDHCCGVTAAGDHCCGRIAAGDHFCGVIAAESLLRSHCCRVIAAESLLRSHFVAAGDHCCGRPLLRSHCCGVTGQIQSSLQTRSHEESNSKEQNVGSSATSVTAPTRFGFFFAKETRSRSPATLGADELKS